MSCQKLTEADEALLSSFNSRSPPKINDTLPGLIEASVIAYPDKIAVDAWDSQITYRCLWLLSGKLASHISSQLSPQAETVVTCFERSAWAVVAMLAIMRTGRAYVPIDPHILKSEEKP